MREHVVVPETYSPSGIGVVQRNTRLVAVSPCCGSPLQFSRSKRSTTCSNCEELSPRVVSDYFFAHCWVSPLPMRDDDTKYLVAWLSHWTGLEERDITLFLDDTRQ